MVIVIPKLTTPTVTVQEAPVPQFTTSVPATGAAVGSGLVSLGVGLNDAAQRAREVSVSNGETQLRSAIDDVLHGPQNAPGTGFLYTDGMTALARSDAVTQRIGELADSVSAQLPDDETRAAFVPFRDRLMLGAHEDIQGHVAQAGNEFKDQSQFQSQAAFVRTGVSKVLAGSVRYGQTPSLPAAAQGLIPEGNTQGPNIINDRALVETLDIAHLSWRAYIAQNAGRFGGGAEMTDEGLRQIDSTFWAQAIRAALAPGQNQDDRLAAALYEAHKDQISVDSVPARGGMPGVAGDLTRESIQQDVTRASDIGDGQRAATSAVSSATGATLAEKQADALDRVSKMSVSDDARALARKGVTATFAAMRQAQEQAQTDTLAAFKDAIHGGKAQAGDLLKTAAAGTLTQDQRDTVAAYGAAQMRGEHVETDPRTYGFLNATMLSDPASFLKADINSAEMKGDLAPADATFFRTKQDEMRKAQESGATSLSKTFLSVDNVIGQLSKELYPGSETDADVLKHRGAFAQAASEVQQAYQQATGKQLDPNEARNFFAPLVAEHTYAKHWYGDSTVRAVDAIPPDTLSAIVDSLIRRGEPVTEDEVWRMFTLGGGKVSGD